MKKVVLKLELHDDKGKQKAMKTVSSLSGVESIAMDMKDKKLTVTGDIDPVVIVAKLRKICFADILTVGPAKEPEKKKEEPKKEEPKKGGDDQKKKEEQAAKAWQAAYYPYPPVQAYYHHPSMQQAYQYQQQYYHRSAEEDPNASCVIC